MAVNKDLAAMTAGSAHGPWRTSRTAVVRTHIPGGVTGKAREGQPMSIMVFYLSELILQRDLGIFGVHRPCYQYHKCGF